MSATLGLDTATDDTAVAIVLDGRVVYDEARGPDSGRPLHGPALLEMIEGAVARAGGWSAVDKIAVGTGPGSFTGQRVGLATAKGLARATGIPAAGVCTLDSLAAGAFDAYPDRNPLLAALDARRGQIFAALYEQVSNESGPPGPRRLIDPFVCDPECLGKRLGAHIPALAAGSGALRFRDRFEAGGTTVPGPEDPVHRVSARWTAILAASCEMPVEPIYLRAPDAERWRERDRTSKNDP